MRIKTDIHKGIKNPHVLQEQDGAWSMRRLFALLCLANAIKISWNNGTPWMNISVFIIAALIALGLTTVSDIAAIKNSLGSQIPSAGNQASSNAVISPYSNSSNASIPPCVNGE